MEKKNEIITVEAKPVGRPKFDFNEKVLQQVEDMASYMCSKQEIAKIIGCSKDTIYRSKEADEAYERGVARAKTTIRKTQFDIATKLNSAQMSMWLGKVYLKQDREDDQEDYKPLPLGDVIDL